MSYKVPHRSPRSLAALHHFAYGECHLMLILTNIKWDKGRDWILLELSHFAFNIRTCINANFLPIWQWNSLSAPQWHTAQDLISLHCNFITQHKLLKVKYNAWRCGVNYINVINKLDMSPLTVVCIFCQKMNIKATWATCSQILSTVRAKHSLEKRR